MIREIVHNLSRIEYIYPLVRLPRPPAPPDPFCIKKIIRQLITSLN